MLILFHSKYTSKMAACYASNVTASHV